MLGSFFAQFNVVELIGGRVLYGDCLFCAVIFTNSSMMVIYSVVVIWLLWRGVELMPFRWQLIMELIHSNARSVVYDNLRKGGEKYFPLILGLFLFIVILNILGLLPYVFTPTAHLVVTFGLSLSIMMSVTLLGVWTFKVEYISILVPRGVPWY